MTLRSSPTWKLREQATKSFCRSCPTFSPQHKRFPTQPLRRSADTASLSGEVAIRYRAVVENNLRQLLPPSGCQHVWSDLPGEVLPLLLPNRFCPSDKFIMIDGRPPFSTTRLPFCRRRPRWTIYYWSPRRGTSLPTPSPIASSSDTLNQPSRYSRSQASQLKTSMCLSPRPSILPVDSKIPPCW